MSEVIEFKIPKMRTVNEVYKLLKDNDPDCKISERYIRELANTGQIVHRKSGRKILINLEKFIEFLNTSANIAQNENVTNKFGITQIN